MGTKTKIEWTKSSDGTPGSTWNPVTGCVEISAGCDHCYAKSMAERFRGTPGHYYENGFDVTLREDKLDLPLRWTKPRRIFVNSMSDLFHDQIPTEYIAEVFAVMALAERHTFQVLTKRHARMRSLLNSGDFAWTVWHAVLAATHRLSIPVPETISTWFAHGADRQTMHPLPNVWLGVSVENQRWADIRVPVLLSTPAAVRFLSMEPLLGPVNLTHMDVEGRAEGMYWINALTGRNTDMARPCADVPHVDWVIVGGESGAGARPMNPDWARTLRDQCVQAKVPFHFKQHGCWAPVDAGEERPGDMWVLGEGGMEPTPWTPETQGAPAGRWGVAADRVVRHMTKQEAGRELDGRTWDETPEEVLR